MDLLCALVWSIETDDFQGSCYGRKFLLINSITESMNLEPIVTETPTTAATAGIQCSAAGKYPIPGECGQFYECVPVGNGFTVIHHSSY